MGKNLLDKIRTLTDELNRAAKAYYADGKEIISNFVYDKKYEELEILEKKTGIVISGSPTQNVGYEVLSELPKERHSQKMLSLDKTKDIQELKSWLGDKQGVLSWKLDGLTVVLTYDKGELIKAVTRGNGEIGEVITNNAKVFANIPLHIPFKETVVVRGEALIRYSDFEKINSAIPEADARYKNPRNLCSGSVRQLDNRITKERNVMFFAFSLMRGEDTGNSVKKQMEWLSSQGFDVVESVVADSENIESVVEDFKRRIGEKDEPSDGLVLVYDDIEYGNSLGKTSKFPRNSIAFKWKDEVRETTLRKIEWSASRTGLINPIAVFDPVELEGTRVSRASVHNVSILKELRLGIGDRIRVYKANMIIPQIAENITTSGNLEIPSECPVCGKRTIIKKDGEAEMLYCLNKACPAKMLKAFSLFVSRDALNIEGLSESTINKLIQGGLVKGFADFFRLSEKKEAILKIEGMGEKSFSGLIKNIEESRQTTPQRFLYALGISGIGRNNAMLISRMCEDDWNKIRSLTRSELLEIDGVGEILADAFVSYFEDKKNSEMIDDILSYITFDSPEKSEQKFEGLTIVITGSLDIFLNRKQLRNIIESGGGKVAGSVSSKTDFLVNNDITSGSSKNKKAKELGVTIISEKDFAERFGINA